MPKVFGIEHIIYLVIIVIVMPTTLILAKKYLKEEKKQTIFIKVLAGLLFAFIIMNRISLVVCRGKKFIPDSFCGMTSLLLSLFVLFGKKNMKCYDCLWYIALFGGLTNVFYPNYIGQSDSVFYIPTISGLIHHTFLVFLSIAMLEFKWFKPSLEGVYRLPLGIVLYILIGYFEIYVLKVSDAMCINEPILSNTPLDCWFILGVGTSVAIVINLILRKIETSVKNKQ